ncbi:MAG: hypothetical protein HY897_15910 [Deltaproteobacteria bacterium]|nr:hypothetical protein [Deltaproteobacteria bacterium]
MTSNHRSPTRTNEFVRATLFVLLSGMVSFACGAAREVETEDAGAPADGGSTTEDRGGAASDAAAADDTGADAGLAERVTLDLKPGCNPFATSNECVFPVPSSFFEKADATSPTGVRLNYPGDVLPNADGETTYDIASVNLGDGVSPVSPILVHFTADADPAQLVGQREVERSLAPDAPIALFNLNTGRRVMFMSEMDANRSDDYQKRYALIVRPLEPMGAGDRHAIAFANGLKKADGNSYRSPPAFAALRDGVLTTNDIIENARPRFDLLFEFLSANGYARDNLLMAWDFTVASDEWMLGPVLSMREKAFEIVKDGVSYTVEGVETDPNENVSKLVWGDFTVPTFITSENTFEFDADHRPVLQAQSQSFPYTMIVPKSVSTATGPVPLTVFGHGIFGEGRDYLKGGIGRDVVQPMAQEAGAVVIATDWIGLSHVDLQIIIDQVIPDTSQIGVVTDRLQQSLINNLVMTELAFRSLQFDPEMKPDGHDLLDPSRVYYYGVSLGGIQGSSFISISNRVQRGVLAVPGCAWSSMLPRSRVWAAIKPFFDTEYPDPLIRQLGIFFMQMRFDHSDPVNLTKLMFKSRLPDAPQGRAVVIQESIGDCQVPNLTTEMLARAIGLSAMTPGDSVIFGLPQIASPFSGSAIVQYHLKEQTAKYMPPDDNTMPTAENNVHSDMCWQPNVLEQVRSFLSTGEVTQTCDGPCDPE